MAGTYSGQLVSISAQAASNASCHWPRLCAGQRRGRGRSVTVPERVRVLDGDAHLTRPQAAGSGATPRSGDRRRPVPDPRRFGEHVADGQLPRVVTGQELNHFTVDDQVRGRALGVTGPGDQAADGRQQHRAADDGHAQLGGDTGPDCGRCGQGTQIIKVSGEGRGLAIRAGRDTARPRAGRTGGSAPGQERPDSRCRPPTAHPRRPEAAYGSRCPRQRACWRPGSPPSARPGAATAARRPVAAPRRRCHHRTRGCRSLPQTSRDVADTSGNRCSTWVISLSRSAQKTDGLPNPLPDRYLWAYKPPPQLETTGHSRQVGLRLSRPCCRATMSGCPATALSVSVKTFSPVAGAPS